MNKKSRWRSRAATKDQRPHKKMGPEEAQRKQKEQKKAKKFKKWLM
jgi:hypothetical protein